MVRSVPSISMPSATRSHSDFGWRTIARATLDLLAVALRVRRERRLLRGLDERMLKDIGLTSGDVEREAGRSFWDVPTTHRRRGG